jgi:ureidoglycolate lyase
MTDSMIIHTLRAEPLTEDAFAEFGQVIGRDELKIEAKDGETLWLDVLTKEWHPLTITSFNRHFKATQAQFSLSGRPFLIVVAPPSVDLIEPKELGTLRAFICDGSRGYNLEIGTWHAGGFPLMEQVDLINLQGRHPSVDIEIRDIAESFGIGVEVRL